MLKQIKDFVNGAQSKLKKASNAIRWFADLIDWLSNALSSLPLPNGDSTEERPADNNKQ